MKWISPVVALTAATLVVGQAKTISSSVEPTGTARATISSFLASGTAVPTGQACAAVSSILAGQLDSPPVVRADLAYECARSAPIVKADALRLIDGIVAALAFQSDKGHLANPPAQYPLAGVDLLGEISQLRQQVNSGAFTSEIDFESNFTAIIGKAQDGHLAFQFDGLSVFAYQRFFAGLVSVSSDGKAEPIIYLVDDFLAWQQGGKEPSAVTQVNGQDVVQFLATQSQNISYGGLQDPDALYNQMFYVLNSGQAGQSSTGLFAFSTNYIGAETTLSFANGTSVTEPNIAVYASQFDFTGLKDGKSFYDLFCNATLKAQAQGYDLNDPNTLNGLRIDPVKKKELLHQKRQMKRQIQRRQISATRTESRPATQTYESVTRTATQISGYPTPVAISDDLSLSGYFLTEAGFEDTAVLVLQQMSEADPEGFQSTMTDFMNQCRQENKKRLVVDVQGNPGGTISLGYEVFKQLFPDVYPYGAGTLAAHEGLDILGQYYTNYTAQLAQQYPDNVPLLASNDYYAQYSAESYANSSGQLFQSWPQFFGPVETKLDNMTNVVRWDINNTDFNLASGSIVVSGFGNNTAINPSPFTSENIILLSDGRCSSTCTILAHFLKWQGKVKSVAVGGRPQNGAMQAIGGVKGSQVYQYQLLASDVYYAYTGAYVSGRKKIVNAIETSPSLAPIYNDSNYVIFRGANAGVGATSLTDFQFNWQNNIAEGDSSYTPLQFVYEAADCRLWYQPSHIVAIENLWATVAAQAFGLNNTQTFSLCVQGSTNAPSSLSGNSTLFNNGVPNNVTTFQPEAHGEGSHNAAGHLAASSVATLVAIAAALFVL